MERPTVALREDKEQFLAEVPPEFVPDAESHWDMLTEQDDGRERDWRKRNPHVNDSPTPDKAKEPYYLTVPQIAVRWNVSERTVWRLISTKELPSVRLCSLRRVLEEDVERFEARARAVA